MVSQRVGPDWAAFTFIFQLWYGSCGHCGCRVFGSWENLLQAAEVDEDRPHCPRVLSQAPSAYSWPWMEHSGSTSADGFLLMQQPPIASWDSPGCCWDFLRGQCAEAPPSHIFLLTLLAQVWLLHQSRRLSWPVHSSLTLHRKILQSVSCWRHPISITAPGGLKLAARSNRVSTFSDPLR